MPRTQVGAVELYYELHGPEGAPVVALVNGILMNAATGWLAQRDAFAARYRLLLHDCRGQGQSDHPDEPYSMAVHADDLAGLFDALGIARAHVLGLSYGGEVAQAFAIAHPERLLGLVLANTVSEVGPELRLVVESWADVARRAVPDEFFRVTVPWNFSPPFIRNHQALLEEARRRYAQLDYPAVVRLCDAFLALHLTPDLHRIAASTSVIWAEHDLIKGRAYADILLRHIVGAEGHEVRGAGHAAHWEQAAEFNRIALECLARIDASTRGPRGSTSV